VRVSTVGKLPRVSQWHDLQSSSAATPVKRDERKEAPRTTLGMALEPAFENAPRGRPDAEIPEQLRPGSASFDR
jgi:hypothetical protein